VVCEEEEGEVLCLSANFFPLELEQQQMRSWAASPNFLVGVLLKLTPLAPNLGRPRFFSPRPLALSTCTAVLQLSSQSSRHTYRC
jgi:hypothetical protein